MEIIKKQTNNKSNLKLEKDLDILLNKIFDNQNQILNLENQILKLELQEDDEELPIGTIIIGEEAPLFGTWKTLGTLESGQTIIGGESSNGSIIKHNHIWTTEYTTIGSLDKQISAFSGFNTYDINGNQFWLGKKDGSEITVSSETDNIKLIENNIYNKIYGVGIGTSPKIFRRES
ncbi:MAG: hypothetical protein HPAVJP_3030 [Candidatus Hepatoplasma vulgare]|nr:MAG: hypothetical protein HPAVJP_3030 [Candidatus Hepatoplasma sp.]